MTYKSLFITSVIIIIVAGFVFQFHGVGDAGNVEAAVDAGTRIGVKAENEAPNLIAAIKKPRASEPANIIASEDTESDSLFIVDDNSTWTDADMAMVSQVISNTLGALSRAGLNGADLIDGYRFRRYTGEYVDGQQGLVGAADHGAQVVVLSDSAFKRLNGFYIYHELGHVVDSRLDRRLSEAFHSQIGAESNDAGNWQTKDGFWMRAQTRDDREEATADAFALWVTVYFAGSKTPVFAGMPLDVQVEGIAQAAGEAITLIASQ